MVLAELKAEKEKQTNYCNIDWEYCIPDCGECCISGGLGAGFRRALELGATEKECFQEIEKVSQKMEPDSRTRYCLLLYGPALCLVYADRPEICRGFGLCYAAYIREIQEKGIDVKGELKEMFLQSQKDYNRKVWLENAKLHILKTAISQNILGLTDALHKQGISRIADEWKVDERRLEKLLATEVIKAPI